MSRSTDTTPDPEWTRPRPRTPRGPESALPWKVATAVLGVITVGLGAVLSQPGRGPAAAPPPATVTVTAPAGSASAPGEPPAQVSQAPQPNQDQQDEFLLNLPRRQKDDPMAMGKVDAPVVVTEWADYRCPFCSVWTEDSLPQLKQFVDEGKIRIEFRDLAIFGPDSVNAAAAARAAGEQGLFWEYQTALYKALPNEGHPPVKDGLVKQIAAQINVPDLAKFEATYKAETTRKAVADSSAEAQQLGIASTPTFLVGSEVISGAQPIEAFQEAIQRQLEQRGS